MFYDNKPINAYFYSNNGNANEVWITNRVTSDIPYLQGGNYTNKTYNVNSENSMLSFFKTF